MSAFLSALEVKPATSKDDGNWELVSPLVYKSDVAAMTFVIPAGFVTNFASVPRIPVVYELAGDTSSEAATVHDFLYSTHPVIRSLADKVLREASAVTDVPAWRREIMYLGVRFFGFLYWGTAATDPTSSATKAAVQPVPVTTK